MFKNRDLIIRSQGPQGLASDTVPLRRPPPAPARIMEERPLVGSTASLNSSTTQEASASTWTPMTTKKHNPSKPNVYWEMLQPNQSDANTANCPHHIANALSVFKDLADAVTQSSPRVSSKARSGQMPGSASGDPMVVMDSPSTADGATGSERTRRNQSVDSLTHRLEHIELLNDHRDELLLQCAQSRRLLGWFLCRTWLVEGDVASFQPFAAAKAQGRAYSEAARGQKGHQIGQPFMSVFAAFVNGQVTENPGGTGLAEVEVEWLNQFAKQLISASARVCGCARGRVGVGAGVCAYMPGVAVCTALVLLGVCLGLGAGSVSAWAGVWGVKFSVFFFLFFFHYFVFSCFS